MTDRNALASVETQAVIKNEKKKTWLQPIQSRLFHSQQTVQFQWKSSLSQVTDDSNGISIQFTNIFYETYVIKSTNVTPGEDL